MINQLNQHKRTWQLFKEWIMADTTSSYYFEDDAMFNDEPVWRPLEWGRDDRELLSLLVEFCRLKGYYIYVAPEWDEYDKVEGYCAVIKSSKLSRMLSNRDYTEATEQAVIKCFELMESEVKG